MPKRGKSCYSIFFPDAWDEERTLEEIAYAFGNKVLVEKKTHLFKGFTTDGIELRIFLDEAGNVISAFPFFP